MKTKELEIKDMVSSSLPQLNGATRDIINYGMWFLYEIHYPQNEKAKYILSTDTQDLLLAQDGEVIGVYPRNGKADYKYIINFSDIPKPQTLNALRFSWA